MRSLSLLAGRRVNEAVQPNSIIETDYPDIWNRRIPSNMARGEYIQPKLSLLIFFN